MAFTFLRSYQPDTEHPDDEEEDEMPMARSGSVRAFSHLPDSVVGKETDAPPPQVVVGRSGGPRPYKPMPMHGDEDEVTDSQSLPRSGSVRAFSHLPDSAEDVDGVGAHQPPGPTVAPQARAQSKSSGSGFVFHPPEQDDAPDSAPDSPMDGRNATMRGPASAAAALGSTSGNAGMTGLPKSLLFEPRLPPGLRDQGSGQPSGLADAARSDDLAYRYQGNSAAARKSLQNDALPVADTHGAVPYLLAAHTETSAQKKGEPQGLDSVEPHVPNEVSQSPNQPAPAQNPANVTPPPGLSGADPLTKLKEHITTMIRFSMILSSGDMEEASMFSQRVRPSGTNLFNPSRGSRPRIG